MADQYQIDLDKANAALKEMMATTKFLTTSVKDLTNQISRMAQTSKQEVPQATGTMGQYADNLEKRGIPSLKEFRTQQRTQNFVIRESTQALTATIFAITLLSSTNKEASQTTKTLTAGLLAGVAAQNATEFAFYGIGRAGKTMDGQLGKLFRNIGANAGALSLFLGAATVGVTLFKAAIDSAAESDKKLQSFNLARLGVQIKTESIESLVQRRADIAAEIAALDASKEISGPAAYNPISYLKELPKAIAIQGQINNKKEQEAALTAEINLRNAQALTFVGEINNEVADLVRKRDGEAKTQKEYLFYQRQIEELERKRTIELKTQTQQAKEQADYELTRLKFRFGMFPGVTPQQQGEKEKGEALVTQQEELGAIEEKRRKGEYTDTQARQLSDDTRVRYLTKIAQVEKQTQQTLHEKEQQYLQDLSQGFNELQSGLTAIGIKADSVFGKFISGFQLAAKLAEQINRYSTAQEGGTSTTPAGLGIIGTVLSILGLFDEGGYTGSGTRYQIAGVVHKGEYVFEKPIVDRFRPEIEMMRAIMQNNYAKGGAVTTSGPSASAIGNAVQSAFARSGSNQVPEIHIHVHNPVTFRDAFKVETRFSSKKDIG